MSWVVGVSRGCGCGLLSWVKKIFQKEIQIKKLNSKKL